jgi:hypothetical protein
MCSGCSGDYAGGFESDDPDSDDFDDPIADAGDGATSASFRGTSETALGETESAESTDGGPAGLELPGDAWESCEILVTGTQILEIRVISANLHGKDRSNDRSGKVPSVLALHLPGKHSSAASAKYYQTRQGSEKSRWYAARSLPISQSFVGACKAKLKGWLQETRRLMRRCTPQSS